MSIMPVSSSAWMARSARIGGPQVDESGPVGDRDNGVEMSNASMGLVTRKRSQLRPDPTRCATTTPAAQQKQRRDDEHVEKMLEHVRAEEMALRDVVQGPVGAQPQHDHTRDEASLPPRLHRGTPAGALGPPEAQRGRYPITSPAMSSHTSGWAWNSQGEAAAPAASSKASPYPAVGAGPPNG